MRTLLIGLAALITLTGCSQNLQLTGGTPTMETQRCAASGGMLDQRGRRGNLMCVHRFVDAGKACASDRDCQGRCLANTPDGSLPKLGEAVPGRCEPDDRTFGCYAEVEGGKAKRSVCVD